MSKRRPADGEALMLNGVYRMPTDAEAEVVTDVLSRWCAREVAANWAPSYETAAFLDTGDADLRAAAWDDASSAYYDVLDEIQQCNAQQDPHNTALHRALMIQRHAMLAAALCAWFPDAEPCGPAWSITAWRAQYPIYAEFAALQAASKVVYWFVYQTVVDGVQWRRKYPVGPTWFETRAAAARTPLLELVEIFNAEGVAGCRTPQFMAEPVLALLLYKKLYPDDRGGFELLCPRASWALERSPAELAAVLA